MLLYINLVYLIHYGVLILVRDYSSYGNLREVIEESRYCEKFFDVVPLKRCGKGQIELARERLVKAVNRLGVVRRKGRSRKVN